MPEASSGPSAPAGPSAGSPTGTRLGVLAAAMVVGLLAAPIGTHTWQATAVTVAIGLVALAVVITGRPRRVGRPTPPEPRSPDVGAGSRASQAADRSPRPVRWSAVPWFVVFALVTVLELGALAYGDRPSFPTVSWLLGPYFVEQAVRFAGYVAWICAGWWLVRR